MAQFDKNLLEAFQNANDERAGGDPVSGGPFASGPFADGPSSRRSLSLPSLRIGGDLRNWIVLIFVALLCFVGGIAVGRTFLSDEARAAAPGVAVGGPSDLVARDDEEEDRGPVWTDPGESTNEALADPANRFTVLAVTYGNSAEEIDLANATYYSFADRGYPVAYPAHLMKRVYVLVGAAPTEADLEDLLERVRGSFDPDGRPAEYADAYVAPIDQFVDR